MAVKVNGKSIATTDSGYLENYTDWDEDVARVIAKEEGIELTDRHRDVIHYLRDEYINNNQNQPMERILLKEMSKRWNAKLSSKDLYQLFPFAPTKQGTKIAGLPAVRRNGGAIERFADRG